MTDTLVLLPAVDVTEGRAVQLVRGVAGSGQAYGDPLEAALRWQRAGASWVHLVDLDAAFGRGDNRATLAGIVERMVAEGVRVELSGGLRDDDALAWAMSTRTTRVNIGTAALEDPDWCAKAIATYGDRVAVGLDVRTRGGRRTLAARGWTREGGDLFDTLVRLDAEGCARYVVTDVDHDGTLQGPNLDLLRDVCAATDRPVVASGGIATLDDLVALASLVRTGGGPPGESGGGPSGEPRGESGGVEGAIVGTALYAGAFTLEQALATVGSAR